MNGTRFFACLSIALLPLACSSSSDGAAPFGSAGAAGSAGSAGASGSSAGTGGTSPSGGAGGSPDGCLDPYAQTFVVPMADAAGVGVPLPIVTDGATLFYGDQGHHLYAAPLAGGAPATLFAPPEGDWITGPFWLRDTDLVVFAKGGFSTISKTGGAPVDVGAVMALPFAMDVLGGSAYLLNQATTSAPYQLDFIKKDLASGAESTVASSQSPDPPKGALVATADGVFSVRGASLYRVVPAGSEAAVDLGFTPDQLYLSGYVDGKVYVSAVTPPEAGSFVGTNRIGRVPSAGGAFESGFESKAALGSGHVGKSSSGVAYFAVKELFRWNDGEAPVLVACFQTETDAQNGATYHGFAVSGDTAYIGVRKVKDGVTQNGIMAIKLP